MIDHYLEDVPLEGLPAALVDRILEHRKKAALETTTGPIGLNDVPYTTNNIMLNDGNGNDRQDQPIDGGWTYIRTSGR